MWVRSTTIVVAALATVWMLFDLRTVALAAGCAGLGLALFSLCMTTLTVTDEGDALVVKFGPIPMLRKRFRYSTISRAEPSRTAPIDGWGIHYIPGRGWTYNIWGRPCVCLTVNRHTVRIGTDDGEKLAHFVRTKIGA
jgi:hypothetical protein